MSLPSKATKSALPYGRLAGAPLGQRRPELRRVAFLDAAAALFKEKGYAATSIDDIVARAGLAKGTFYHYFQDRADMLAAMRQRFSQHLAGVAAAAMAACADNDWAGRLDAWVATLTAEYLTDHALVYALFVEPAVCQLCAMGGEPVVVLLADFLAEGEQAGAFSAGHALSTAVAMFHAVLGVVDEALATHAPTDTLAPLLATMLKKMVRADAQ